MAMKENDKYSEGKSGKPGEKERGIVGTCFDFVFDFAKWYLISMLFSVIVAFIGVTFFWSELGSAHERMTLEQESTYLAEEIARGSTFIRVLSASKEAGVWNIPSKVGNGVEAVAKVFTENFVTYGETANYSMRIFILRSLICLSSFPILIIYTFAAIVIGLVERDLRRFNLARESSTKFHLLLNNAHISIATVMILYLSWPVTAHPMFFIAPGYLAFGVMVFGIAAGYKKYL